MNRTIKDATVSRYYYDTSDPAFVEDKTEEQITQLSTIAPMERLWKGRHYVRNAPRKLDH